jgi:hypothetical protein
LTNSETFKEMMEAVRTCSFHESVLSVYHKNGSYGSVCFRLRPVVQAGPRPSIVIHVKALAISPFHAVNDPQQLSAVPSLEALLSSLELGGPGSAPHGPCSGPEPTMVRAAAGAATTVPADEASVHRRPFDELVLQPPSWALVHVADLLTQLRAAGLVMCWEWATMGSGSDAAASPLLRILADEAGLRARAARSGGCPTGLLCFWLLVLIDGGELPGAPAEEAGEYDESDTACRCGAGFCGCRCEAAAAEAACGGLVDTATDFGFLVCAER